MNRNPSHRRRLELEPLDDRLLMAAGLTAGLSKGVLTIRGTATADVIDVVVEASARGKRSALVSIGGIPKTFQAGQVKQIVVNARAGDDTITVENRTQRVIPTRIVGGAGNDTINGAIENPPIAVPPPAANPAPIPIPITVTAPPPIPDPAPSPIPAPNPVTPAPTDPAPTLPTAEQRIADLTNAERVKAGLAPLAISVKLNQAARIQSENMARLDVMAHELPGSSHPTLTDRIDAAGYRWTNLAENIAFGYPDADAVVAGWMASTGHRANILNPRLTEIGVSIASNAQGVPYYTQVFGRPA